MQHNAESCGFKTTVLRLEANETAGYGLQHPHRLSTSQDSRDYRGGQVQDAGD
jgi:hypothetical protein